MADTRLPTAKLLPVQANAMLSNKSPNDVQLRRAEAFAHRPCQGFFALMAAEKRSHCLLLLDRGPYVQPKVTVLVTRDSVGPLFTDG